MLKVRYAIVDETFSSDNVHSSAEVIFILASDLAG